MENQINRINQVIEQAINTMTNAYDTTREIMIESYNKITNAYKDFIHYLIDISDKTELIKEEGNKMINKGTQITGKVAKDIAKFSRYIFNAGRKLGRKLLNKTIIRTTITAEDIETKVEQILSTVNNQLNKIAKFIYTSLIFNYFIVKDIYNHLQTKYENYKQNEKSIQYFENIEEIIEIVSEPVKEVNTNQENEYEQVQESEVQIIIENTTNEETIIEENENEIEITNISDLIVAIENKFANETYKHINSNQLIEYDALPGKKCKKGYRRVGNACILISHMNATGQKSKRPRK